MFSKFLAPSLLVAAALAGCQVPMQPLPVNPAALRQPVTPVRAQSAQARYVELHVPAGIKQYADDYLSRLARERQPFQRVDHQLTVQVSTDGGKTFQQGGSLYAQVRPAQDGGLIVPLYLAPGTEVVYYLKVEAALRGDGLYGRPMSLIKQFEPFFVSDFGRNYRAKV